MDIQRCYRGDLVVDEDIEVMEEMAGGSPVRKWYHWQFQGHDLFVECHNITSMVQILELIF